MHTASPPPPPSPPAEQIQKLQGQLEAERKQRGQQAEQIQSLHAQLQAERANVSRLQGEVEIWKGEASSMEREIAELKKDRPRNKATGSSNVSRSEVVELALSACTHVQFQVQARQLQDARAWVVWMGDHLPCDILQQHRPRVIAALLLHAAWCMEWGDGFPFARCLARLVECTRNGHRHGLAFPERAPLLAMQFLNLSAADCGQAAELHCKLLMLLGQSAPKGLPGSRRP